MRCLFGVHRWRRVPLVPLRRQCERCRRIRDQWPTADERYDEWGTR